MLCSLFVLLRRTRTVSSAMWACAKRAPAELGAEGASPARGSARPWSNASCVDFDARRSKAYRAAIWQSRPPRFICLLLLFLKKLL